MILRTPHSLLLAGLLTAAALIASPASAQGRLLADYLARIGPQDQVTSTGTRLDTAAAVLRQDRANFHRFDQADEEDEADEVFADQCERGRFERLMARGLTRPEVRRAIVNGSPLVRVRVYPTRVDVDLVNAEDR